MKKSLKLIAGALFVFALVFNTAVKSVNDKTTFSLSSLEFAMAQDPEEGDTREYCVRCVETWVCVTTHPNSPENPFCYWDKDCETIPCG